MSSTYVLDGNIIVNTVPDVADPIPATDQMGPDTAPPAELLMGEQDVEDSAA